MKEKQNKSLENDIKELDKKLKYIEEENERLILKL